MRNRHLFSQTGLYKLVLFSYFFISSISQAVFADGKYFPEKAYKVSPGIPSQRAIIVYKDGIETLIIESILEGKGKEFGWIIPLPAEPNGFREVSPGLIKTLSVVLQPEITHDLGGRIPIAFSCAGLVISIYLIHLYGRKHSVMQFILLIIIIFIVLSLLMPSLNKKASISISGIEVRDINEVGNYKIFVLKAQKTEALDRWLDSNGFAALDKNDKTIVNDYIKDNWCFVAAKLKRNEDGGLSQPHPLEMTFPSKKILYPLRLTSTVGNDVYLDIFVISNNGLSGSKLTLELSDRFIIKEKAFVNMEDEAVEGFAGEKFEQKIGHPEAFRYFWDGCIISRFCGILRPDQMNKDIVFDISKFHHYQKHYWSKQGAWQYSFIFFFPAIVFIFIALHCLYRGEKYKKVQYPLIRAMLLSFIFSSIGSLIIYAMLPKVKNITTSSHIHNIIRRTEEEPFREKLSELVSQYYAGSENISIEQYKIAVADLIQNNPQLRKFEHFLSNSFEGGVIKQEDSPGNYVIFKDERGIVWRTYTGEGFPDDYVLVDKSGKKSDIQ